MPHVFANGCDMDRQIQYINIHAEVQMKQELYHDVRKRNIKLEELQEKLEQVLKEYFDDVGDNEPMTNHEYNCAMSSQ